MRWRLFATLATPKKDSTSYKHLASSVGGDPLREADMQQYVSGLKLNPGCTTIFLTMKESLAFVHKGRSRFACSYRQR